MYGGDTTHKSSRATPYHWQQWNAFLPNGDLMRPLAQDRDQLWAKCSLTVYRTTFTFNQCYYDSHLFFTCQLINFITAIHHSITISLQTSPLPSARQHPSYGDCLQVMREYYQNCSVLDCVTQCSQSAAHLCEQFLHVKQIGFVTLGPLCSA